MFKSLFKFLDKGIYRREIELFSKTVEQINALEERFQHLDSASLTAKTREFRQRLDKGETLEALLPEAFAAVREAARRTVGLRHYDVQLIGGIVLVRGAVAEMRTGEGKTLAATLPLFVQALYGQGAHLVTVNDYLARRDARWMGPVFHLLGLSVGVLQAGQGGGDNPAYLFDPGHDASIEIEQSLRPVPRREAYLADITYGTNSEFGFDYLRDNLVRSPDECVQRGHFYAIVDEVDNVLVDEARTPLIIAGENQREVGWYLRMAEIVRALRPREVEVSRKDQIVNLKYSGERRVEGLLGMRLRDPNRPEEASHEQQHLMGHLEQALRARFLFQRDRDYLIQDGQIIIIDEFTGRQMPGRRWTDGLHQAVEAKEGLEVQSESITLATISLQNYFRLYEHLAGMTGTALTASKEFEKIYKLKVHAIPTHVEYQALRKDSYLEERQGQAQDGYSFTYYVRKNDPHLTPLFWKRIDYPDVVFLTAEAKLRAIVWEILQSHLQNRPLLIGTTSVADSEHLSGYLQADRLRRLALARLLRAAWLSAHPQASPVETISELEFTNRPLGLLSETSLANQAGKQQIEADPTAPANLSRLLELLKLETSFSDRLAEILNSGIPHQVLNARKHFEESQIIAGAGALGAVTIATNMAGRGVDIKLGGEMAEEVLASANQVLENAGIWNAYSLSMDERQAALQQLAPEQYGAHAAEIHYFLDNMREKQAVKHLWGLHIIGSTRHEARRIDQQLRGRAARQGDPGSSRFFVSMEDDLLVRYGSLDAEALLEQEHQRNSDPMLPVTPEAAQRVVELAQNRVEEENYEIRKRLLEYDDVLNAQRKSAYRQRNRVLEKADLQEDVSALLQAEITARAGHYLAVENQPWRLAGWLEQVQPTLLVENPTDVGPPSAPEYAIFPGWPVRKILDSFDPGYPLVGERRLQTEFFLQIARKAVESEQKYTWEQIEQALDQADLDLNSQVESYMEIIQNFLRDLEPDEIEGQSRQLVAELSHSLGFPVKLSSQELRLFDRDPYTAMEPLRCQVEAVVYEGAAAGVQGAIEGLLGNPISLPEGPAPDWDILQHRLALAARQALDDRAARLLGEGGLVYRRLEEIIPQEPRPLDRDHAADILERIRMPVNPKPTSIETQGTSSEPQPHDVALNNEALPSPVAANSLAITAESPAPAQPVLSYAHLAGHFLENQPADEIAIQATEHLSDALTFIRNRIGQAVLNAHYRRVLLSVMDEHWEEFLNKMEALRYEVRLEGLAHMDPVVVYKTKAAGEFERLMSDLRAETVQRLFLFGPLARTTISSEASAIERPDPKRFNLKLG